ncbi:hypothetical protein BDP27DRAFT_1369507 [Rhodocollybia butyracea]|uniref:Uncharacterized protein n=1 Tax=Rhodocollybia butyracea TaxID=206335 RepID=A0A9P5PGC2_9AGAR|nr:hypothetical protein BDP27DRAFT_1369507 [Rhodocollybia butyracea]
MAQKLLNLLVLIIHDHAHTASSLMVGSPFDRKGWFELGLSFESKGGMLALASMLVAKKAILLLTGKEATRGESTMKNEGFKQVNHFASKKLHYNPLPHCVIFITPGESLLKELCLRASPGKKGKIFRGYMVEVKRKEEDIIVRQERKIYAIWEGLATGKGGSTSTPSAGAGNPKKRPKKLVEVEKMPADVELVEEPVFTYTGDFDDSCDVPILVMVKHVISEGKKDINGLVENNNGALECTADAEDPNIEVPGVAEEMLGRGKRKMHVPAWHGKDWIFTRDSDVEEGRTKKQR